MKLTMKSLSKAAYALLVVTAMTACSEKKFHVTGKIAQAKDSVLYFENMSLDGPQIVDSVKLDGDGGFSFDGVAPDAPEFYRLRIAGQIINVAIDSTETVNVNAAYPSMATQYTIEGSENNLKIKELTLRQMALQAQAQAIVNNPQLGINAVEDSIFKMIDTYKDDIKKNFIYKEPMKSYAYFALFQGIVVGNSYLMVFDPRQNPDDVKAFAAIATSWDTYYPGSLRGENLHNIALQNMKDQRIVQNQEQSIEIDADKVSMANLIDIALTDNKGNVRRLTDLAGKVVLLDFHLFSGKGSTQRIMMLRELYNKYHDRGLEIYQVSLDEDEHFWKTQTAALPWICVRDNGTRTQAYLATVKSIPCDFIINRENTVIKAPRQIKDLNADIAAQL
jgi:peroxiredoxin